LWKNPLVEGLLGFLRKSERRQEKEAAFSFCRWIVFRVYGDLVRLLSMQTSASEFLRKQVLQKRSALVLGVDPRLDKVPFAYPGLEGLLAFHQKLIEICAPYVVGIKPQIAFFEALGTEGLALYAETCAMGREAGLAVIGDVKRGDIGSTAEAYARAHFAWADWLTVNPLLGADSVEPFLKFCREEGKGVFILCATSNPSWRQFEGIVDEEGQAVYQHIGDAISGWNRSCLREGEALGPVGAVIGATHPEIAKELRGRMPDSWFLLPGVGAQGGRVEDLGEAFLPDGTGALLPVSRGLGACFEPGDEDWEAKVTAKAAALVAEYRGR
jgi:orotidine-5'-phosphate decarboxylase